MIHLQIQFFQNDFRSNIRYQFRNLFPRNSATQKKIISHEMHSENIIIKKLILEQKINAT